jgi:hypothetical protein
MLNEGLAGRRSADVDGPDVGGPGVDAAVVERVADVVGAAVDGVLEVARMAPAAPAIPATSPAASPVASKAGGTPRLRVTGRTPAI